MANIDGIGLAEPSTITKSLAGIGIDRNGTTTYQEIMSIGSPNSTTSLALAEVMGSAPASTTVGLVTRVAGVVTIAQSTATDLLARVNQGVGNSSAADRWRVNAANSSAVDFTPVRLVDSSGTGFLTPGNEYTAGSTYSSHAGPTLAYDNSSNNTYRTVGVSTPLPVQARRPGRGSQYSTVVSSAATSFYTVVSSAATAAVVRGYSITSTAAAAIVVTFHDSTNNTPLWGLQLGSQSSGVTGANLALPDGLFAGTAGNPITVRVTSTGVEVVVSVSYHGE